MMEPFQQYARTSLSIIWSSLYWGWKGRDPTATMYEEKDLPMLQNVLGYRSVMEHVNVRLLYPEEFMTGKAEEQGAHIDDPYHDFDRRPETHGTQGRVRLNCYTGEKFKMESSGGYPLEEFKCESCLQWNPINRIYIHFCPEDAERKAKAKARTIGYEWIQRAVVYCIDYLIQIAGCVSDERKLGCHSCRQNSSIQKLLH